MTISIKDPEADRLARELSAVTGESITTAVATAVRERLERVRCVAGTRDLVSDLLAIADRCAALPVLDNRPTEQTIGYDADGVPA